MYLQSEPEKSERGGDEGCVCVCVCAKTLFSPKTHTQTRGGKPPVQNVRAVQKCMGHTKTYEDFDREILL